MTPFQMEIRQVMRGYAKKGGKKFRALQIRRLERLADFAATRGTREAGQIGPRTFIGFKKEFGLSDKTIDAYERAFKIFLDRRKP